MRRWRIVRTVSVVIAAVALAAGCSGGSGAPTVKVALTEFKIAPDPTSVKSGDVTFDVTNDGTTEHEMVLIKTDEAPADLPMENGEASEDGSVGEVADLAAGSSGTLKVQLDPGTYVMICNLPGHYTSGMRTAFTVS